MKENDFTIPCRTEKIMHRTIECTFACASIKHPEQIPYIIFALQNIAAGARPLSGTKYTHSEIRAYAKTVLKAAGVEIES